MNDHTSVKMVALPECDLHKYVHNEPGVEARYDAKTREGRWAYMCERCFEQYGTGLGLGRGQRMLLREEVETLDEQITRAMDFHARVETAPRTVCPRCQFESSTALPDMPSHAPDCLWDGTDIVLMPVES